MRISTLAKLQKAIDFTFYLNQERINDCYFSYQKCIFAHVDKTVAMKPESNPIKIVHNSLKGVERERNQDDILLISDCDSHLFVLFDGVSSLKKSIDFIQKCKQFIQANYTQYIGKNKIDLEGLIYDMHKESIKSDIIGKTTCSALLLKKGFTNGYFVSIGDSRVYTFSNSYLEQLTRDDILPGNSNILTKCIGWDGLRPVDINQMEVDANQNFLMCSDGFYSLIEKNVMSYFRIFQFKRKGNIINAINRLQKDNNRDDASYIIIRNEGI